MAAIRESTLGEVGNLAAPPGSRDWAVAIRLRLQYTLNSVKGESQHIATMAELMRDHKGYLQLADKKDRPFATYESFCVTPQPFGLGYRTEDINRIIGERKAREAADRAKATVKLKDVGPPEGNQNAAKAIESATDELPLMKQARENKGSNTTIDLPRDRSASYLTARIARDRPDILERMKAGEFKSVRQAAIEAGIVELTVIVPLDPIKAARRLRRHFQSDRLAALISALQREETP